MQQVYKRIQKTRGVLVEKITVVINASLAKHFSPVKHILQAWEVRWQG